MAPRNSHEREEDRQNEATLQQASVQFQEGRVSQQLGRPAQAVEYRAPLAAELGAAIVAQEELAVEDRQEPRTLRRHQQLLQYKAKSTKASEGETESRYSKAKSKLSTAEKIRRDADRRQIFGAERRRLPDLWVV